jgi:leucine-rich repeat protein SHOC2
MAKSSKARLHNFSGCAQLGYGSIETALRISSGSRSADLMTPAALEELIETARCDRLFQSHPWATPSQRTDLPWLELSGKEITNLPESIGNLTYLTRLNLGFNHLDRVPDSLFKLINLIELNLSGNRLTILPESLGNLTKLIELNVQGNRLTTMPNSLANLSNLTTLHLGFNGLINIPSDILSFSNLTKLDLGHNQLSNLPDNIGNLTNLIELNLKSNQLNSLPENIGNLDRLIELDLSFNQIASLPASFHRLTRLVELNLAGNPLTDLSILQNLPKLKKVKFLNIGPMPSRHWRTLPRRYWTKLSDWKPEWLLDENNAEIRQTLIEYVGYEKICSELNAVNLDNWREYTLLKIDKPLPVNNGNYDPIGTEPMVLLKMTCSSTQHIHILRVPPEMVSAEAAIMWVNHGIHPDKFLVQT